MFQNNPLLTQLKQQLQAQTLRVEGVIKATEKGFGFLEINTQKSYFIPPVFMKKVMHGDKVAAVLHIAKDREIAEPETLIEPFLSRFVGRVYVKNKYLAIIPDHPLIKEIIPARPLHGITYEFHTGDWAMAEMRRHPLKGAHQFYAEITALITTGSDHFAPWWVTLARHNLERYAPAMPETLTLEDEGPVREDLTALDFITVDNANTEDMDDALYVVSTPDKAFILTIAIADPTAWVPIGSELDIIARDRAFTNYLPGFNIPMLPRILSDNLCSLRAHERRPALVCQVRVQKDGTLANDAQFFTAWIKSKAKLTYDNVSDWLENNGKWQPENDAILRQICLLHRLCQARIAWRQRHAVLFKDRPGYRFLLDEIGNVQRILIEHRRIANRMIEEAMIAANVCAARVLRDKLGFGLYNVHNGFDATLVDQAVTILQNHHIISDAPKLLTLEGFCALRRELNALPTSYLDNRIRRFQTFAEVSTKPGPHYGMGLDVYATWTSPIRKYGDMINHRLLKALIGAGTAIRPSEEMRLHLAKRRRKNRMAERDVSEWLYARFLKDRVGSDTRYSAEIIDVSRGGVRVRLLNNGAIAFIPASFIHNVRAELIFSQDNGTVQIKGKEYYRQGDTIEVIIVEVRMKHRAIIARPI